MRPAPTRCPICQSELSVVRLHCQTCDTSIEGHFASGHFTNLSPEQLEFVFTFVRCEGKINRMEQELGVSYPTIRNRLHEVIRTLGYEPGKDEPTEIPQERRNTILEDLSTGKISAEEATRLLRGEEEQIMSKTISAGPAPKIVIESIGGDLSLVGWESQEILIKADDDEMRFAQNGEEVKISCDDDISIRVPRAASVIIQNIGGDASIRGVMGGIELKEIGGDLSIRDVDSVAIDTINSDFSLRGAKGHLSVRHAHSDVSIRDVDGNVSLESVADDLALRDVRGNVTANVSADVVLYLNPQPGNSYAITGGDDILLVMPPKANATLTLSADEIEVDWKGVELDHDATSRVITIGDGSASITLTAGGDIRVTNQSDAGESAEDFGNFAGIGVDWSGFGERISRQVENATRRATKQAEDAARRATERLGRRGPKLNVGVGRWNWDVFQKGGPIPPRPQASEEERLAILKMLQEKKITADEADKLLSALEGEA